jgi:hypothetical protein
MMRSVYRSCKIGNVYFPLSHAVIMFLSLLLKSQWTHECDCIHAVTVHDIIILFNSGNYDHAFVFNPVTLQWSLLPLEYSIAASPNSRKPKKTGNETRSHRKKSSLFTRLCGSSDVDGTIEDMLVDDGNERLVCVPEATYPCLLGDSMVVFFSGTMNRLLQVSFFKFQFT